MAYLSYHLVDFDGKYVGTHLPYMDPMGMKWQQIMQETQNGTHWGFKMQINSRDYFGYIFL